MSQEKGLEVSNALTLGIWDCQGILGILVGRPRLREKDHRDYFDKVRHFEQATWKLMGIS